MEKIIPLPDEDVRRWKGTGELEASALITNFKKGRHLSITFCRDACDHTHRAGLSCPYYRGMDASSNMPKETG